MATKQYNTGMKKMKAIHIGCNGTNPKNFPIKVNGTKMATMQMMMVKAYTVLEALLSINGILAVLMMCKPIKFETIP